MSLRNLPEGRTLPRPQNFQWEAPGDVFQAWADGPQAAASDDESTISIFEVIGEDFWTGGGMTAKRMAGILRSIGEKPVKVQINSPGGDVFEGIAIFNLLRKHNAKVTVEVLGWAASAASIIAMAGDEITMNLGSFMMVHNAWGVVMGNRHDLSDAAELLGQIDSALVDIYVARTGQKADDIEKLMDRETWLSPLDAVDKGFADKVDSTTRTDDSKKTSADPEHQKLMAKRRAEAAFAKAGIPRNDRRDMINALSATPRDASRTPAERDAGDFAAGVRQLIEAMKS
jgi:ATP-dependent Clp endopeptidase proteolytic subunit ClpP